MTATLLSFPIPEILKTTKIQTIQHKDNVVSLYHDLNYFTILVNEFHNADIEIVKVCDDMENIILPDDYVIQCMGQQYHIIKIKITDDAVIPRIIMTTKDAGHLAGVIEWYQSNDMMDEQFQV